MNKRYDQFPTGTYNTAKIFLQADSATGALEKINLPSADTLLPGQGGNAGKFLQTNGTTTSWATAITSAAGSSGQLQFNVAGALGASINLAWDSTNNRINFNNGSFYIGGSFITASGISTSSGFGLIIMGKNTGSLADLALANSNGNVALHIDKGLTSVKIYGALTASSTIACAGAVSAAGVFNAFTPGVTGGGFGLTAASNPSFPAFEPNAVGIISNSSGTAPLYLIGSKIKFEIGNGANSMVAQFAPSTGNLMLQNGGTYTDSITALLQLSSTTKGLLPPRMTTSQKNAISSPAEGLIVYDITLHKLCLYTGSAWETITSV